MSIAAFEYKFENKVLGYRLPLGTEELYTEDELAETDGLFEQVVELKASIKANDTIAKLYLEKYRLTGDRTNLASMQPYQAVIIALNKRVDEIDHRLITIIREAQIRALDEDLRIALDGMAV